jgi:hypothetical protein
MPNHQIRHTHALSNTERTFSSEMEREREREKPFHHIKAEQHKQDGSESSKGTKGNAK